VDNETAYTIDPTNLSIAKYQFSAIKVFSCCLSFAIRRQTSSVNARFLRCLFSLYPPLPASQNLQLAIHFEAPTLRLQSALSKKYFKKHDENEAKSFPLV